MKRSLLGLLLSLVGATSLLAADDLIVADFEGTDYGKGWVVTGTAFGSGPAQGTLRGQMPVSGFRGKGLVNTFFQGDGSTGTLTSPPIKLERKYLNFLIGGGKDPEKLALQLLIDGKVVRSATGPNDRPGGSEELSPDSWDVAEFAGKDAVIRIVDQATGPWGHINVDHIVQSDRKPVGERTQVTPGFDLKQRYLLIPIKNGAKKRIVTLLVDGKGVVRNEIELAEDKPDWWAVMDVAEWQGRKARVSVDKLRDDSKALEMIVPSDTLRDAENLYKEPLRGQFHFSPRRGWNNDPNGMVYYKGEYHLFFQHNPYGWGWGNMHWGHAVSKDMVHWEELGDKLMPDQFGPMFSGSAVVDHDNTSGFGKDGEAPLVLIYTAAGNPTVQCIAYSRDGRTFTKWDGNPVVKQVTGGNRDPKVIWHAPTKKWVMVLYVEWQGRHTVHFYTSPNLKEWTLASILDGGKPGKDGYLFECPDFFELPVEGEPGVTKWELLGANSEYAVGTFDGTRFTPEKTQLAGQQGKGFYAPQTFSNIPAKDGRRIQIGWFQTATPGMPFNQSMTIPQQLTLTRTADGPRMVRTPVKELIALRSSSNLFKPTIMSERSQNPLAEIHAELAEVEVEFEPVSAKEVTLDLRGAKIVYDVAKQDLIVQGHRVHVPLRDGKQSLHVYVDRTGVEVFAAGGLTYVPMPYLAKPENRDLSLSVKGGNASIRKLAAYELRSAWSTK